jgi:hypothetical protein
MRMGRFQTRWLAHLRHSLIVSAKTGISSMYNWIRTNEKGFYNWININV